jgi:hypothetical protein
MMELLHSMNEFAGQKMANKRQTRRCPSSWAWDPTKRMEEDIVNALIERILSFVSMLVSLSCIQEFAHRDYES